MAPSLFIRSVDASSAAAWERMRRELWPAEPDDHKEEVARFLSGKQKREEEVLIAFTPDEIPIGFIELSIRPYAEGCRSEKVAYIEGLFVEKRMRKEGAGAALVKAAEEWGRAHGCMEIASDTEIENESSIAAHKAFGFDEVMRVVCFRKDL
ncbi:MAG: GNAT family N-acetyltransferase [Ignavibacteriales bacterium]|nr:GNAT family N-acetyltransferase [Ignavibacteriales bacterium]